MTMGGCQRAVTRLPMLAKPSTLWRTAPAIGVVLITAIGLALRAYGLDTQSLWYDELFSLDKAHPQLTWAQVWASMHTDSHPPLYYLLLHGWLQVFGFSAASARALSVVAGVLAIPATYILGRIVHGHLAGVALAAMAATNYFLVYYAQEARFYALLHLFATCTLAAFVVWVRKPNARHTAVFATCAVLTAYTHYFGLFFLASLGLLFLVLQLSARFRSTQLWRQALGIVSMFVLVYLPVVPDLLRNSRYQSGWIPVPTTDTFFEYLRAFVGYSIQLKQVVYFFGLCLMAYLLMRSLHATKYKNWQSSKWFKWIVGLTMLILFFLLEWMINIFEPTWPQAPFRFFVYGWLILAVLAGRLWLEHPDTHAVPFTVLAACSVLLVCFGVPFVRSIYQTPMLQARYEIVLLPVIFLLVGQGMALWQSRWLMVVGAIFFLALGVQHLVLDRQYYTLPLKEDWQPIARAVAQEIKTDTIRNTLILAHPDEAPLWPIAFELAQAQPAIVSDCDAGLKPQNIWVVRAGGKNHANNTCSTLLQHYRLVCTYSGYNAGAQWYQLVPAR